MEGKGKAVGFTRHVFKDLIIEGEFNDSKMHGWVRLIWSNGDYFVGNYRWNKKHGFGIQHKSGETCQGLW